MDAPKPSAMTVDLRPRDGGWQVTIERDGRRDDIGGLDELIRVLETLADAQAGPVRGLR